MSDYEKEEDFFFNSRKLSRAITRVYDKYLKPCGISSNQFVVMAVLQSCKNGHREPICSLANTLFVERSTLSRMLKSLEECGIAEMVQNGRVRFCSLTRKGSNILNKAIPLWRKANDNFMSIVGKDCYRVYIAELGVILDAVDKVNEMHGGDE